MILSKAKPTYAKKNTIVNFHGKYDATFSTVYESPHGPFFVCRHMRCCFGSKVVIDTWMERPIQHTQPHGGKGGGE